MDCQQGNSPNDDDHEVVVEKANYRGCGSVIMTLLQLKKEDTEAKAAFGGYVIVRTADGCRCVTCRRQRKAVRRARRQDSRGRR
ncbi:MAG: hypothetical protein V1738_03015 [Patescibacteria group bacterium]